VSAAGAADMMRPEEKQKRMREVAVRARRRRLAFGGAEGLVGVCCSAAIALVGDPVVVVMSVDKRCEKWRLRPIAMLFAG